jgi:hypothetical protein
MLTFPINTSLLGGGGRKLPGQSHLGSAVSKTGLTHRLVYAAQRWF